jgi:hypothetical protein
MIYAKLFQYALVGIVTFSQRNIGTLHRNRLCDEGCVAPAHRHSFEGIEVVPFPETKKGLNPLSQLVLIETVPEVSDLTPFMRKDPWL